MDAVAVSRWLRDEGAYISPLTLRKHRNTHLTDDAERARREQVKALEAQAKLGPKTSTSDLAALVRDRVVTGIEAGELAPTVREGLIAQDLLDRRMEKGADRSLALKVAALIAGAYARPALDDDAVEGEVRVLPSRPLLDGGPAGGA